MLDRFLHVTELPLSEFKLCFSTIKVHKEKTINSGVTEPEIQKVTMDSQPKHLPELAANFACPG